MSSEKSPFTSRCAFQLPCDGSWVAPQNHYSLVKDLPWGGQEVFLRINRRQFKCENCGKPFSEDLDFVRKRKKYTNRYAHWITQQVINSNLLSVAFNNKLTESEVEAMITQVAESLLPLQIEGLKRLGIDEISLVKGQGKFIIVLVDLDTGKLIGLVKEKKSKTIEEVMKSWGEEVLEGIEEVSMDLCKQYQKLINKICKNAVITVDRFHVTKILHEEVNQVRIEQKKTAKSLNIEAREKLFSSLKGTKYVLLKREEDLNTQQKEKLLNLKEASIRIKVVHELKEEFTEIFETSQNWGEGTLRLADWLGKAQAFLPRIVKTIINWFGEVVGYFERKTTNAQVEGMNNRLKVIKRCGFGFRNFDNFERRALLYWHLPDSLA
ncbi:MAG: ISL3 family transposase [Xenococcus sp. (in: cyanobacteria)]